MQKKKSKAQATPLPLFDLSGSDQKQELPQHPVVYAEDFTPTWRLLTAEKNVTHVASPEVVPPDLLTGLNDPQRQAVTTTQGPMLLLAGPGSGKTRVITHRIAYLILHQLENPQNILALTFTNRAAREMNERLEHLVGVNAASKMVISTFHSLCARLLRQSQAYLLRFGLTPSFGIADETLQERAVNAAIQHIDLNGLDENQKSVDALLDLISHAKNDMLTPDEIEKQARREGKYDRFIVAQVYREYERLLRKSGLLDFDDLLIFTVRLLRTDHQTRLSYQQRWRYIEVDEWQDTNMPQYQIIRLLGYGTDEQPTGLKNVCVVGDDDQMIYSWRGASMENLSQFESDFQPTTIILNQNYRSTKTIVEAAQSMIRENAERKEKHLWTDLEQGAPVLLVETDTQEEEAQYVVETIQSLYKERTITGWDQVAILYRTNAQSRGLEEACLHAGLPYTIIGNTSFYERKEVKDILAYLRVLVNQDDDLSLLRICNVPPRGIGKTTLSTLQEWAETRGLSLFAAMDRVHECPALEKRAKRALNDFVQLLTTVRRSLDELTLPDLLDQVVRITGLEEMLKHGKEEKQERWENILEFRRVVAQFAGMETRRALDACLEHVALMSGADMAEEEDGEAILGKNEPQETITLLTLHSAKGLEFPVCFLVGMEEGLLPHSRVFLDVLVPGGQGVPEERRLAYVGLSRAMKRLYLVRALQREVFGKMVKSKASRFLDALPDHLIRTMRY